jgi:hypothetical protein
VNDPEDRWKTGDLDEKDTPLSCQPWSPSKTGYQTHGKCSPNGKEQDNRFKSQEHCPSAPTKHSRRTGNILNGRLRLLFIASPSACLLTSLLAVYRPPSCIPLSVLSFLAFRLSSTVARVSRRTNMTMGRYTPKVTDCQLDLISKTEDRRTHLEPLDPTPFESRVGFYPGEYYRC